MTIKQTSWMILAAILFTLGVFQTVDPDLWWHLKTGQVILGQGIPSTDIFSFTMAGSPWVTHEWLSQVVLWWLYAHAGGFPVLMIAFALIAVIAFGFVYDTCSGRPLLALLLTLLAFWTTRFLWGARPQIFNILMLALLVWIVERVRQKRFGPQAFYALPVLIMVWANLHSGYLMGLAVLAVYLVGDVLQLFLWKSEEGTLGRPALKSLGIAFPLCILASLANPSGYKLWFYPFETLHSKMMQTFILEWKTPDFHYWNYKPFLFSMVLGAVAFMASRRRRNIAEMVLYAGAMAAGLLSRRHIPFFAVVALPIISRSVVDVFAGSRLEGCLDGSALSGKTGLRRRIFHIFLALIFVVVAIVWTRHEIRGNEAAISRRYPVEAVKFIKEKGLAEKHGFNEYVWGGYLIWADLPVFIDGRADMYGDRFFRDYLSIRDLKRDWNSTRAIFKRFDVTYALVPIRAPFAMFLRLNKQWREVYRDKTASVFVAVPESVSPQEVPGGVAAAPPNVS